MPDAAGLLKTIKKAAVDAVEANKPVNLCFGIVTNTSPLKINVEQKMELGEAQLLLSRNVTDYTMKLEASMETEPAESAHSHTFQGRTEWDRDGTYWGICRQPFPPYFRPAGSHSEKQPAGR